MYYSFQTKVPFLYRKYNTLSCPIYKLDLVAQNVCANNYLSWISDVMVLGYTSLKDHTSAMIFLH